MGLTLPTNGPTDAHASAGPPPDGGGISVGSKNPTGKASLQTNFEMRVSYFDTLLAGPIEIAP